MRILCALILSLALGCAAMQEQAKEANVPPPGCEDSLIWQNMPYPKAVGTVIQLASYNVAEEVGGAKAAILRVVDRLEIAMKPVADGTGTMNGAAFVALVLQEIDELDSRYTANLLIVGQNLEVLNIPSPLTQCDGREILAQLVLIRQWVSMARPGE